MSVYLLYIPYSIILFFFCRWICLSFFSCFFVHSSLPFPSVYRGPQKSYPYHFCPQARQYSRWTTYGLAAVVGAIISLPTARSSALCVRTPNVRTVTSAPHQLYSVHQDTSLRLKTLPCRSTESTPHFNLSKLRNLFNIVFRPLRHDIHQHQPLQTHARTPISAPPKVHLLVHIRHRTTIDPCILHRQRTGGGIAVGATIWITQIFPQIDARAIITLSVALAALPNSDYLDERKADTFCRKSWRENGCERRVEKIRSFCLLLLFPPLLPSHLLSSLFLYPSLTTFFIYFFFGSLFDYSYFGFFDTA